MVCCIYLRIYTALNGILQAALQGKETFISSSCSAFLCGPQYLIPLWQKLGDLLPNGPCASLQGKSKHRVWTPPCVFPVQDHVVDGSVDVDCGHALSKPLTLHVGGRVGPNLRFPTISHMNR